MNLRKAAFSAEALSPWRLPMIIEMQDGQAGVLDKVDALWECQYSVQR